MTHPFHPLYGRDFEFVAHRQNWGEDQVHLHDENGRLFSLPAGWTDVAAPDLQYIVGGPFEGEPGTFFVGTALLKPDSRGSVRLRSAVASKLGASRN